MKARFEDLEILTRHIPILRERLDDLHTKLTAEETSIPMGNNADWIRVQKVIQDKVEQIKNGNMSNVPIKTDIKSVIDTIAPHFKNLIPTIDYICYWIYYASEIVKIFNTSNNVLTLRAEFPLTLRACDLFVTFSKTIAVMHYLSSRLNFAWFCSSLAGTVTNITCSSEFIDKLLANIVSKPFDYVALAIKPLRVQLENLTTQLSTIFSQLFAVYSLFEWSILSIEGAESLDSESTLLHSNYIVLQHLYLFYETILFFGLVFPQFFSHNANFGSFAISIYSETQSIRLTNSFAAPVATILNLASETLPLKIMNSGLKDIESKLATSHPKRIKCLTNLFLEYLERGTMNEDLLGLYFEQILAIYGFALYEILICHESSNEMYIIVDMIAAALDLRALIERNEQMIQRTYLYTLRAIDVGYLRDLSKKCRKVSVSLNSNYLQCVNSIASQVNCLDLEAFDNGIRYDIYPLLITHGRVIAYPFTSGTDDDVSVIYSLLEHMMAMIRHLSFVDSPMNYFSNIFHIHRHLYIVRKLPNYLNSDESDLHQIISLLRIFTIVPFNKEFGDSFTISCDNVVLRILRTVGDTISVKSKNVISVLQNNLDPDFDISRFLPPARKNQRESYLFDSKKIRRIADAMDCVMTMPDVVTYGSMTFKLKERLCQQFGQWIDKTVLSGNFSPFYSASIFNMLDQVVRPFFTQLGIPYLPTLLQKTRSTAPLTGDESFQSQYKLYTSQAKPKPATLYINNYINQLMQFIETGHKTAQYEQLCSRFVTVNPGSIPFFAEQYFAVEPMKYILMAYGLRAGVRINAILMSQYFVLYNQMVATFLALSQQINTWYNSYLVSKRIDYKAITTPQMKECSELLLRIGIVKVLRVILGRATRQTLNEIIPSLNPIVDSKKDLVASGHREAVTAFLESIHPGETDDFLVERSRLASRNKIDVQKFLFFLGLLFANHDWDDAKFDSENDQFTYNLQLLPSAMSGLVAIIKGSEKHDLVQKGLALFFQVLATIAGMKKVKSRAEYSNFVILVHHLLDGADQIKYGDNQNAFFFAEIRSCYNEVAQSNV